MPRAAMDAMGAEVCSPASTLQANTARSINFISCALAKKPPAKMTRGFLFTGLIRQAPAEP
ncbi:MAG: hypothetical protein DDT25_00128 [Chloroflexi bacterium]|nr:hypothetical protein [Chloroflexota bacterium]